MQFLVKVSKFFLKIINLNAVGSTSIVELLLDNGADINGVDKANNSALIQAISKGRDTGQTAELLIRRGANPNIMNERQVKY